MYSKSF